MSMERKIKRRKKRRALIVRNRLRTETTLPRISVFRSLKHVYAQIIDDVQGKTVASFSSLALEDTKGSKKEIARAVGVALAKEALQKGIKKAAFDRGSYLYHGRVKELAEGARSGGLEI